MQTYVYSGQGGDKSESIEIKNLPKAPLQGAGLYYVKSKNVTAQSKDGLSLPSSAVSMSAPLSYYEQSNGLIGLAATQYSVQNLSASPVLITDRYEPVFYDAKFTMSAGQILEQTNSFRHTETSSESAIAQSKTKLQSSAQQSVVNYLSTMTQKIRFVGIEILPLDGRTYTTCKFELQSLVPASTEIVNEWYLVGKGIMVQSTTTNSAGEQLQTIKLESASVDEQSIFPAAN